MRKLQPQFSFFSKDLELLKGLLVQVTAAMKDCEDLSLMHDLAALQAQLETLVRKYGG